MCVVVLAFFCQTGEVGRNKSYNLFLKKIVGLKTFQSLQCNLQQHFFEQTFVFACGAIVSENHCALPHFLRAENLWLLRLLRLR